MGDELQTEDNSLRDGCESDVKYLGAKKFIKPWLKGIQEASKYMLS